MLTKSVERILALLDDESRVLDVGGWAKPFRRADVVLDRMPYETRGQLGFDGPEPERFSRGSWVERDMCAREPWPFSDKEFDFAVCSHTLEDVRDPVWVCSELVRVARAGYIETPSRLEEQSFGFQGPWVGYGHHHWLVDLTSDGIEFSLKHHVMHGRESDHFPAGFRDRLSEAERMSYFFWTEEFAYRERIFDGAEQLDGYLASFVSEELAKRGLSGPVEVRPALPRRVLDRLLMAFGSRSRVRPPPDPRAGRFVARPPG